MKVLLSELPRFVQEVLRSLDPARDKSHATLIVLRGDLGAGKTTFVQALAAALGVGATVQSPTYVLMKKYDIQGSTLESPGAKVEPCFTTLVHIDAYRLEHPGEFAALRPREFLHDPTTLVVVEWPERLAGQLPAPDLTLQFSATDASDSERYIEAI